MTIDYGALYIITDKKFVVATHNATEESVYSPCSICQNKVFGRMTECIKDSCSKNICLSCYSDYVDIKKKRIVEQKIQIAQGVKNIELVKLKCQMCQVDITGNYKEDLKLCESTNPLASSEGEFKCIFNHCDERLRGKHIEKHYIEKHDGESGIDELPPVIRNAIKKHVNHEIFKQQDSGRKKIPCSTIHSNSGSTSLTAQGYIKRDQESSCQGFYDRNKQTADSDRLPPNEASIIEKTSNNDNYIPAFHKLSTSRHETARNSNFTTAIQASNQPDKIVSKGIGIAASGNIAESNNEIIRYKSNLIHRDLIINLSPHALAIVDVSINEDSINGMGNIITMDQIRRIETQVLANKLSRLVTDKNSAAIVIGVLTDFIDVDTLIDFYETICCCFKTTPSTGE